MSLKKLIEQFSLLAILALIIYSVAQIAMSYRAESAEKLEKVWQQDLENLHSQNKLPSYWSDIRTVEREPAQDDSLANQWVKSVASPIVINPNGQYKLEILFISQTDSGQTRAVVQHHLIHIPSGNSVWELGRTYDLN